MSEEPLRLRLLGAEWRSGRSRRAEASRYVGHGEEQQQGDDISAVPKTSRVLPDDSRKCMKISATSALFVQAMISAMGSAQVDLGQRRLKSNKTEGSLAGQVASPQRFELYQGS